MTGDWNDIEVLPDASGAISPDSIVVEENTKGKPSMEYLVFEFDQVASSIKTTAPAEKVSNVHISRKQHVNNLVQLNTHAFVQKQCCFRLLNSGVIQNWTKKRKKQNFSSNAFGL